MAWIKGIVGWAAVAGGVASAAAIRPPAVPLVANDPYLSIWSEADRLNGDVTRHWTHHEHPLVSLIRIDEKSYRLMGNDPNDLPAFPQQSVKVLPLRSIYEFDNGQVHVTMTFTTPMLPDDLDVLTRPLTYIAWSVKSVDGMAHQVSVYDSASALISVEQPNQPVDWATQKAGDLTALRAGTVGQTLLTPPGDDTRIDWGYLYLAADAPSAIGGNAGLIEQFVHTGTLDGRIDAHMPRPANQHQPVLAFAFDLGKVSASPVDRHVIVAYDEIYSIRYFGKKLRPFWRRNGAEPADLLQQAEHDYAALTEKCKAFDEDLMSDLNKVGGSRYADLAALSYRQALAACGIAADDNKQPLLFTKENTSNGDIATVDVFYPMDPMLILFSPSLTKASLVSNLMYAASPHWKFPNAPHDLGTYPVVSGRDDGGEGMPVEESGNMLLLCDAVCQEEGSAAWVKPWWPQLSQWAKYLEKYGLDPEEQLCTDDFMGHLAHNANLSVKAILALAAYGDMCRMNGDDAEAKRYFDLAKKDAEHWVRASSDGDHSRLAFDKPGTWSQKYNLVWDGILKLNVFPPEVAKSEVNYYKKVMQKYGVPLDSRTKLTKTDWSVWSATLADNRSDFEAIVSPMWDYLDQTTTRDPVSDSFETDNVHSGGMHARPVVGGVFVKMLAEPDVWKKWAGRDHEKVGNWAPLPTPPQVSEVVPTSRHAVTHWRYTTQKPAGDWTSPKFDDSGWKEGVGAFGTQGTPNIPVKTRWDTDDVWLRREVTLPAGVNPDQLELYVIHDEDVDVHVNGVPAASEGGFITDYQVLEINPQARAQLKPGSKVTLAVHCHQTQGGQGVDVGIVSVK